MSKLRITNASVQVRRSYEACGPYQWARELLMNALEAGATRVEFGIEWQAVEKLGAYRRTIIDDGCGMSRDELRDYFLTLNLGGKKIGGVHDNFGVGGKITTLPWNEEGVVVISYKDGRGSMIWIYLDEDTNEYEMLEWEGDDGTNEVIDPAEAADENGIDWDALRPSWVGDHGTIVVLLGNKDHPDTVLGDQDAGEGASQGLTQYLNARFWTLNDVQVQVHELSAKKTDWPRWSDDKERKAPHTRTIRGARYFWTDYPQKAGGLREGGFKAAGTVMLADGRVKAHWHLWDGQRPDVHNQAPEGGFFAVKYRDELYGQDSHASRFRWFGVIEKAVQTNLCVVLEPNLYDVSNGKWGIHPDQSRNRLIFTGNGQKGELPLVDWAAEFSQGLPDAILEAISAVRGEGSGTITDDSYRQRLQDRFGDRYRGTVLVPPGSASTRQGVAGTRTGGDVEAMPDLGPNRRGRKKTGKRKKRKPSQPELEGEGAEKAVKRPVPLDVPLWRAGKKEDFEKPWHIAMWAPFDLGGPKVVINTGSPFLEEMVAYHQRYYADHLADEVREIVVGVLGEIACAKVAHAQTLSRQAHLSEEAINEKYRSEEALTFALMGLVAEEAVISQRLGKLGRKKDEAA